MNIVRFFDSLGRDLRYALRGLPRRPTFTLAAVVTLALGIGATTAIFSVVYSVVIKPLPYPDAQELVRIRHAATGSIAVPDLTTSPSMYLTYREENDTFSDVGLWWESGLTMTGVGDPERVRALSVTDGALQALGVLPMRGRLFTEEEHGPQAEGPIPVVLTYQFWQRRFGGDEAALGERFSIDSGPSQVVGIMPPDFRFLDATLQPELIVAVRLDPAVQVLDNFLYHALGRLQPDVTVAEARADLERMLPIWLDSWPVRSQSTLTRDAIESWRITPIVRPLKDDLVGGVSSMLWVLMSAIGAALLVACANVANLMLVRADERRQELAVRAALGAVPRRIARQLLLESLIIGAVGGMLGVIIALAGLRLLVAIAPSDLPRLQEIALYPPVLAFTALASIASALLFGSIAAIKHALHVDLRELGAARWSGSGRGRGAMRSALVIAQVALAVVLVVGAALMIRTFQALRDVDPGFSDAATIQTARVWIPPAVGSDAVQSTAMEREILERIAALPGVESVGFASGLPMEGQEATGGGLVIVEGEPEEAESPQRRLKFIAPGYFETMGTQLIAGRNPTWGDIDAGGRVAVISEDFAREIAAEPADALGKRIRLPVPQDAWREVIGVVQGVHEGALYEDAPSVVYWPVFMEDFLARPQFGTSNPVFVVRSDRAGTAALVEELRRTIWSVNGNLPITLEGTMEDLYANSLARTSFTLVMLAVAGGMALLLGVVGIYGVIAYVVSQRSPEIGLRSALGAEPRHLAKMFLLHGLTLSAAGGAIGLFAAAALAGSMSSLLFGVEPLDPTAYFAALGLMLAAAALASYFPARRAATIDPVEALRAE